MEGEQSQISPYSRDLYNSENFVYSCWKWFGSGLLHIQYTSLESTAAAAAHEILGRLSWVCTSLQFGLSSSLAFYDTDQGSYKVRSSFWAERIPRIVSLIQAIIISNERRLISSLKVSSSSAILRFYDPEPHLRERLAQIPLLSKPLLSGSPFNFAKYQPLSSTGSLNLYKLTLAICFSHRTMTF